MDFSIFLLKLSDLVWGMPFLLFFFSVCIFMTIYLDFIQFNYFISSIKMIFGAKKTDNVANAQTLTPFQAFMNTLGGNIGNGSLAGVPVAIAFGGPGAIFWLLAMSTFSVALRFAEVYLATEFSSKSTAEKSGPMYYLSLLPAGNILSMLFAIFCFGFMITGGNLIQCNAVAVALERAWQIPTYITAIGIFIFIGYVVLGGSARIVKLLDKLVPVKVYGFLISAIIVLIYHITAIPQALYQIVFFAFKPEAFLGGALGLTLQTTMALGLQRGINASEAGLGTAAVAFGTTKGQNPVDSGILSMLSVYINTHIVCFLVALCVLVSGAYTTGETSTALLISSYETVFGGVAGWIVSILVVMFAISVVVAYAYNAKICWQYLTNNRFSSLYIALYISCTAYGAMMKPGIIWNLNSLVTAGLFLVNIFGLLYFAPRIKAALLNYKQ
ncbi:sodium:alanine symporter family protein [Candidatus Dependentiae bacterium]|nr:sodium:alanine symporter family protein [Candidatus Dependentiae bacterium]